MLLAASLEEVEGGERAKTLSVTSLEPHRSRTSKLDSRSRMLLTPASTTADFSTACQRNRSAARERRRPGSFHPLQAYKRRVCNLVQFSAMACSEASVSSAQRVRSSDVSAGHFCATCRHPSSVKCLHPGRGVMHVSSRDRMGQEESCYLTAAG